MELGQRLKEARLSAGLSQRQLCGEVITRNMLSQIENGAARPSMDTLRYLAARLEKPVGYFLEEQVISSPNQQVMANARQAYSQGDMQQALTQLGDYRAGDGMFDWEYHFLCALCRMEMAAIAIRENRSDYGWSLLEEAAAHGEKTPYYTSDLERRRLVLCYQARPDMAVALAKQLPDMETETLLRADAVNAPEQKGMILDGYPSDNPRWHEKRADAFFAQQDYQKARLHYEKAPQNRRVFEKLELCCKELEDFKNAYYYAVKARE